MDITFLDSNLDEISVLDIFESAIWTDRYTQLGDLEIKVSVNSNILFTLGIMKYARIQESEHLMVLETFNIHTDLEKGNKIIIMGRSLESILDRRIIWSPSILSGNFQSAIQTLLTENIINPIDTTRKINNFEFEVSTDPIITALTIESQFFGDYLYDVISNLCFSKNVGFKITLTDDGKFRFKLYAGSDRSYNQLVNSYVVFSPDYENLRNSDYIETDKFLKTAALVAGESGVGNEKITTVVTSPSGAGTGLSRRETYMEFSDISRNTSEVPLTDEEYIAQLEERGIEELSRNIFIQAFDGEVDINKIFIFNEDFFMGDIIQITNEYGYQATSRIIEITYSQDKSGIKIYPTFSTLD